MIQLLQFLLRNALGVLTQIEQGELVNGAFAGGNETHGRERFVQLVLAGAHIWQLALLVVVEQRCGYLSKQRSVPQDEIADRVEFVERRLTVNVDQSIERQMKRAKEGKLEMIDALARQPRHILLIQVAEKLEIHGFACFRFNVLRRRLKALFG